MFYILSDVKLHPECSEEIRECIKIPPKNPMKLRVADFLLYGRLGPIADQLNSIKSYNTIKEQ